MRSRWWAFPVLALLAAALGAACSDPVAPTPDAGVTCAADGATCSAAADCCSYHCAGGTCGVPINDCTEDNQSCISDLECCSALCDNAGFCGLPGGPGTCRDEDTACQQNSDCCTYHCVSGTCTFPINGCTLDYVTCALPGDCCSGVCSGGVCDKGP
jgi:hypothetical protein